MHTPRFLFVVGLLLIGGNVLSSCKGGEADYPIDPRDERRLERGKLSGDGITLFGDSSDDESGSGGGSGIGVNSFLWRAALDTFSFMPLASADPFGGVIITDWYEDPKTPGERFKANIVILSRSLIANGVNVRLFRQIKPSGADSWKDATVANNASKELENTILTRARELRLKAGK